MSARVYAAAQRYAASGVAVFPCRADDKRPLTTNGLHDASTDDRVIRAWARRWATVNLGIATGPRSGLVVIDLDVKRGADGRATLAALERDLGPLPETRTSATPSGGEHRWFRAPAVAIRNAAGRIAGEDTPGVDVRGEGGYVIAPPSSIDGRAYAWTSRVSPAALPPRWIEALTPHRVVVAITTAPSWRARTYREADLTVDWCERALEREVLAVRSAPHGTRNDRLWRSAAALGGLIHTGALSISEVTSALWRACASWPASQRDEPKDRETIERGIAFGVLHPRELPDLGGHRVG